ncbi:hypothetical protein SAMN05421812_101127 [Asanoa hainanensis]|uniref:Uncharacterized protein n=1 Tax=Asanoa hainanensis TaxID=560556 RepID=A0A239FXR6_9ACTN|nr:hypothetical protein SAMN05421812_101127 [Asanoa hainanensis]
MHGLDGQLDAVDVKLTAEDGIRPEQTAATRSAAFPYVVPVPILS